jgi:N-acyl-phosphatidylethanolamine-hydrolysing phospholipase D
MKRKQFIKLLARGTAAAGMLPLLRPAALTAALAENTGRSIAARPDHHDPAGGFRNPWPMAHTRDDLGFLQWQRERQERELVPNPPPEDVPQTEPRFACPLAPADELRITWVGHATFLVQIGGINLLTDPHWSHRASPVQFAGPSRFVPPGIAWQALPPIDAVLLSHDHYDHLDDATVRALRRRYGDEVRWFTPLEYRRWFRSRQVRNLTELDWWGEATIAGPAGDLRVVALPCQHWTSRNLFDRNAKLWASWAVIAPNGQSVYFAGDSGFFPGYPEIGARLGRFDALLLPIGAYEPRWRMRLVHMNPEEAILTYLHLGGDGTLLPMHWGTWRLTDEDPLEPPARIRRGWRDLGLPEQALRILPHGGTWSLRAPAVAHRGDGSSPPLRVRVGET